MTTIRQRLSALLPPLLLMAIVLPLGLATRKAPHLFPGFVATYGGDTLWATVAYLCCWVVLARKPWWLIATVAGAFCLGIELSQLLHWAWLEALRDTAFGGLVLGRGWLWSDLLCYAVGVLLGVMGHVAIAALTRRSASA